MLIRPASGLRMAKYSIGSLPLPPSSHILTHNLTPDPIQPSVYAFYQNLTSKPSAQRRSRILDPSSHFSYVAPLPLPFPYRIAPPEGEQDVDKAELIEEWLSKHEPLEELSLASGSGPLKKYTAREGARNQKRILLAVAATGLNDCLPHLDVGDAFDVIGSGSLSKPSTASEEKDNAARQELIDVLSGHSVLMDIPSSAESEQKGYAPWSLRYSGHQFGTWAGQLGDGRAISLLSTPHPSDPSTTWEIQIKGGGRTPFSRGADGLAVLRSSIREFLGAEAVHALGIPSTRSLSLISLPNLPVAREKLEYASIATRLAPSFLRIGSFQTFNSPEEIFYLFGGGAGGSKDWEGLRILGEWVANKVLKLDLQEGEAWGKKLVLEVARRNGEMLGGWQAYGFMHGVMNTDNISLLGLTIDYGPFAFMDVYDYNHICNHSDDGGRYSFKMQPTMIIFALRALLNALSPLIGAESSLGHAVGPNWAKDASEHQIAEWSDKGEEIRDEVDEMVKSTFEKKYWERMRERLGLKKEDAQDVQNIIQPLLDLMQAHGLDFHGTFRALCAFRPEHLDDEGEGEGEKGKGEAYGSTLRNVGSLDQGAGMTCPLPSGDALAGAPTQESVIQEPILAVPALNITYPTPLVALLAKLTPPDLVAPHSRELACRGILAWLEKFAVRIAEDQETSGWSLDEREKNMRGVNPRFVLRQWVLEEVIAAVDKDNVAGRGVLTKTLEMATNPFKSWGAEDDNRPESELSEEERAERRFCGVGAKNLLGFQCSCSS
ncbi:YdiU domain protein [Rhizoctonia solani AG-3 Rhs1AP]|uniref:Selenoprotein O n=1 Tax=Rhizoctonia solani AG-3 Rhs1AP TaxID=1086054 RepID=X8J8Q4_9AGAM|nr:YdiU domain protein [Rhizoctonia solani AG-3 Rhs1AP]